MRIYHGSCSHVDLRKAREHAPSHVHGHCWNPNEKGSERVPYFVDNGEFSASQNGEEWDSAKWLSLLDELSDYAYKPDFIVLPDCYNDAHKTVEKHRKWAQQVLDRGLDPAPVIQPGMSVAVQINLADGFGADFVFVGGETRWKRAHGSEIVQKAHKKGLKVHIGNPSGEEGLLWAQDIGADSADTTSVVRSQSWHWLEKLEESHLSTTPGIKGGTQATLAGGGSK